MQKKSLFTKLATCTLALTILISMAGCVKKKIIVKVNPDGSGQIVLSNMFSKNVVEAVEKQLAEQKKKMIAAGMDTSAFDKQLKDPFFNKDQIKMNAKLFGENIEFVKAKKLVKPSGSGYIALFSFKNIEDVKLDMKGILSLYPNQTADTDNSISFKFTKGDIAKLQVMIPHEASSTDTADEDYAPTLLTDQEKAQMMQNGKMFGLTGKETTKDEIIRKMMAGVTIKVQLQVSGKMVKSTATYKDAKKKNRCTLLAMDFSTILKSDRICSKLAKTNQPDMLKLINQASTIDGITFEQKPEITLEFKKK